MATSSFYLKGYGDRIHTSPFYLKKNGIGIVISPFYLKGMGMDISPLSLEGDWDGQLSKKEW